MLDKGDKERLVMLSPRLLMVLRTYWKLERPAAPCLFNGDNGKPMDPKSIRKALVALQAQRHFSLHVLGTAILLPPCYLQNARGRSAPSRAEYSVIIHPPSLVSPVFVRKHCLQMLEVWPTRSANIWYSLSLGNTV